jgi:hypothetical protein
MNGPGPGGSLGYAAGREVPGDGSLPGNPLTLSVVFYDVANRLLESLVVGVIPRPANG